MRLLVLDHFFSQDIDALRRELGPGDEIRTLEYDVLRSEALRIFPKEVAGPVEHYAAAEQAGARDRYAVLLRKILQAEFARCPFDAFVVPSDVFFYVRAAPPICHDLGVPFIVVQKETTVSGLVMEFNDHLREHAPPIGDAMTACSQTLRDFWVRAGADPEASVVTGQPRFDYYLRPEWWPRSGAPDDDPVALFLSYHVDHHHPLEGQGVPVWDGLHRETEAELWKLARSGWRVLIKPHPQQPWQAERRRLKADAGPLLGDRVELIEPGADVRRVIVGVDAIVGFQSTALIEAMVAGKPVIYTGWDPEAKRLASDLLPFGSHWRDLVVVVEEREDLVGAVHRSRGRRFTEAQSAHAGEVIAEYLGVVDGRAAERTVAVVRDTVARWERDRTPVQTDHRERVAAGRAPGLWRVRGRHRMRAARRRLGAMLGR